MQFFEKLQKLCCTGRNKKELRLSTNGELMAEDIISTQEISNSKKVLDRKRANSKVKQRNPWQKSEDSQLLQLYEIYPQNWQQISKYMEGRTGKQIRDRYINALDPNINHKEWTQDEDQIILQQYLIVGSKWSVIGENLKGRPENMIKNRFYSFIKKKLEKSKVFSRKCSDQKFDPQLQVDDCFDYQSQGDMDIQQNTKKIKDSNDMNSNQQKYIKQKKKRQIIKISQDIKNHQVKTEIIIPIKIIEEKQESVQNASQVNQSYNQLYKSYEEQFPFAKQEEYPDYNFEEEIMIQNTKDFNNYEIQFNNPNPLSSQNENLINQKYNTQKILQATNNKQLFYENFYFQSQLKSENDYFQFQKSGFNSNEIIHSGNMDIEKPVNNSSQMDIEENVQYYSEINSTPFQYQSKNENNYLY